MSDGEQVERVCVVVLWDVALMYTLLPLTLVLPRDGSATEAKAHWDAPIPDEMVFTASPSDEPAREDEADDLDQITQMPLPKTGSGDGSDSMTAPRATGSNE